MRRPKAHAIQVQATARIVYLLQHAHLLYSPSISYHVRHIISAAAAAAAAEQLSVVTRRLRPTDGQCH